MSKRKLLQLGVTGGLVLLLAVGGIWMWKGGKFASKADTLAGAAENLTLVLPSIADDVPQSHWAYQGIDAAMKFKTSYGDTLMPAYPADANGNVNFRPDDTNLIALDSLTVYVVKALNKTPCATCTQSFPDVPKDHWAFGYIERAYRDGLLASRNLDGAYWPGRRAGDSFIPTASPVEAGILESMLFYAGKSYSYPADSNLTDLTFLSRASAAGMLAKNLNLPGDAAVPSVYGSFDFPENADSGFDFGFEVWRSDLAEPIYVQDPPEEGMEEGSDIGMFYDQTVAQGKSYAYTVKVFNRDGDYLAPSQTSIGIPTLISGSPPKSVSLSADSKTGVKTTTSSSPTPTSTSSSAPTPSPSAALSKNILSNSSFELRSANNFNDWTEAATSPSTLTADTSAKQDGSVSAKFTISNSGFASLQAASAISVQGGQKYILSFYGKSSSGTNGVYFRIKDNQNYCWHPTGWTTECTTGWPYKKFTTSWQRYTFEITPRSTAGTLTQFQIARSGSGTYTVNLDALQLEKEPLSNYQPR